MFVCAVLVAVKFCPAYFLICQYLLEKILRKKHGSINVTPQFILCTPMSSKHERETSFVQHLRVCVYFFSLYPDTEGLLFGIFAEFKS